MQSCENVVVIVVDTARASDAFDSSVMPSLSRLARQGTRYTSAYSSAPWTLPAHASLFTGTYPTRHGAHGETLALDPGLETIASTLQRAGYSTCGIPNNTWVSAEFGLARGFETFRRGWQLVQSETDLGAVAHEVGLSGKLRTALPNMIDTNGVVSLVNLLYRCLGRPWSDKGAQRTTAFAESWIEQTPSPFFFFINYLEPHIPYEPPTELARAHLPASVSMGEARAIRQDPRAYDVEDYRLSETELAALHGLYRGELAYVDAQISKIVSALKRSGAWEETIVVIVGDHGENIGNHGFLGHQFNVYDSLLHVPLVFHGGPFDGGTVSELVQVLDIGPTLLDALGIEAPAFRSQQQGLSVHPTVTRTRTHAFAEYIASQPSVETLEDRYGSVPDRLRSGAGPLSAIRTPSWKLIDGPEPELYHVETDPAETHNRAGEEPAVQERLTDHLAAWRRSFQSASIDQPTEPSAATTERLVQLGYR
ncbi:MAG: sulfatase [Natrialbaceae archaeon]|nr:sulfatase [Natrialbaceae archaeon]